LAHLFQKRETWYISVSHKKVRVKRSLGTKSKRVAERMKLKVEQTILTEIITGKKTNNKPPIKTLIPLFLKSRSHCAKSTLKWYKYCLKYDDNTLPENPTTRSMVIRAKNVFREWINTNYDYNFSKIDGGHKYLPRTRHFNDNEMEIILNEINPPHFQDFIRFLYYTGARHGEVRNLKETQGDYVIICGKTGTRTLKLNHQAQKIDVDFNYTKDYIVMTFRRNMKRLGIKDARPHDIRRTFATNLILKGVDIYSVSKLLGHTNISTTIKHYAHLLVKDIDDFTL
jgi:integrase